jgi:5-(carboxyamino)imidazole ribonucleotide mutase
VACVSVGEVGAKNAALLAVQIIARHDEKLAAAYRAFKTEQAKAVEQRNRALQGKIGK